jgi:hypothetical protein
MVGRSRDPCTFRAHLCAFFVTTYSVPALKALVQPRYAFCHPATCRVAADADLAAEQRQLIATHSFGQTLPRSRQSSQCGRECLDS